MQQLCLPNGLLPCSHLLLPTPPPPAKQILNVGGPSRAEGDAIQRDSVGGRKTAKMPPPPLFCRAHTYSKPHLDHRGNFSLLHAWNIQSCNQLSDGTQSKNRPTACKNEAHQF